MRDLTKEELQEEYEDSILLFKNISINSGNFNPKYKWTSSNTNRCINKILDTFAIDDGIKRMFDYLEPAENENISTTTKLSKCILVTDLLKYFTKVDMLIMIYYAFDKTSYYELLRNGGRSEDEIEEKYSSICDTLNTFLIHFISDFQVNSEILSMLGNTSKFRCKNELAVRILWYNGKISLDKILEDPSIYSEEFTDYIIDHILILSRNLEGEEKRNMIYKIYHIMESRRFLPVSKMFIDKHSETIKQACAISEGRSQQIRNMCKK